MISCRTRHVLDALPTEPFLRRSALRGGVPPRALDELTSTGSLRQPLYGVLVRADVHDTLETCAAAVRLVLPDDAAICRGTAAWLLGVDARPLGGHRRPPDLECTVRRGRTPVRRPGLRCYASDLVDEDVTPVRGLPCTSAERTAVDLARWSTPGVGLASLDAMARAGLIDPATVLATVDRWSGAPFIEQARRLISLCDPAAESPGESWLRLRFHDAGFPTPKLQISLTDATGVERRRLDLGYREKRYAWEYDGEEFHLGLQAEAGDRRRREEIDRCWGWTVVGVGKNLVLGPSMALEYAIGEVVGMAPLMRRRTW